MMEKKSKKNDYSSKTTDDGTRSGLFTKSSTDSSPIILDRIRILIVNDFDLQSASKLVTTSGNDLLSSSNTTALKDSSSARNIDLCIAVNHHKDFATDDDDDEEEEDDDGDDDYDELLPYYKGKERRQRLAASHCRQSLPYDRQYSHYNQRYHRKTVFFRF